MLHLREYEKEIKQKNLHWKSLLPWPGFEPGLLRPQRNVLTTIRSRRCALLVCLSCICPHVSWSTIIEISLWSTYYAGGIHIIFWSWWAEFDSFAIVALFPKFTLGVRFTYFFLQLPKRFPLVSTKSARISSLPSPGLGIGGFDKIQRRKDLFRPDQAHFSASTSKEKSFRRAGFEPAT